MALTAVIYGVMGLRFGGDAFDGSVVDEVVSAISSEFHVGVIAFIPVVLLLTLIFLKKPAMLSMMVSALVGGVVAVLYQGMDANNIMNVFWTGYKASTGNTFLDTLLNRGGVTNMSATAFMMIFAFGMIGAFNTVGIMEAIIHPIAKKTKSLV